MLTPEQVYIGSLFAYYAPREFAYHNKIARITEVINERKFKFRFVDDGLNSHVDYIASADSEYTAVVP